MKLNHKYFSFLIVLAILHSFGIAAHKDILCFESDGSTNIEYLKADKCCKTSHAIPSYVSISEKDNCHGCQDLDVKENKQIHVKEKSSLSFPKPASFTSLQYYLPSSSQKITPSYFSLLRPILSLEHKKTNVLRL